MEAFAAGSGKGSACWTGVRGRTREEDTSADSYPESCCGHPGEMGRKPADVTWCCHAGKSQGLNWDSDLGYDALTSSFAASDWIPERTHLVGRVWASLVWNFLCASPGIQVHTKSPAPTKVALTCESCPSARKCAWLADLSSIYFYVIQVFESKYPREIIFDFARSVFNLSLFEKVSVFLSSDFDVVITLLPGILPWISGCFASPVGILPENIWWQLLIWFRLPCHLEWLVVWKGPSQCWCGHTQWTGHLYSRLSLCYEKVSIHGSHSLNSQWVWILIMLSFPEGLPEVRKWVCWIGCCPHWRRQHQIVKNRANHLMCPLLGVTYIYFLIASESSFLSHSLMLSHLLDCPLMLNWTWMQPFRPLDVHACQSIFLNLIKVIHSHLDQPKESPQGHYCFAIILQQVTAYSPSILEVCLEVYYAHLTIHYSKWNWPLVGCSVRSIDVPSSNSRE